MKAKGKHLILAGLVFTSIWGTIHLKAAESPETLNSRDTRVRERYEQVLDRNPFQDRAFTQVFESYLNLEGVDAWVAKLTPRLEDPTTKQSAGIILGQIYARQFKTPEAIKVLEEISQAEGNPPEYNRLLGTLFYREGENEKGIQLLTLALETLTDLEERTQVSRMLGNLFLRDGNTEQAIEVWKQVTAQSPDDLFAQLELGEIYQENRLWDEAIEVFQRIASLSERDPYRKCRALRSIGNCQLQAERFPEAIATYETALELVSPGNWLFEDLKLRLVQVYEDMGDLTGLVSYVKARLDQNPTDIEFRDLLAETYLRTNQLPKAEIEYQSILERNPRHAVTFEKLIALYQRLEQPEKMTEMFEKLIELFPADTDYLRRLGEAQWRSGEIDLAKQTWERLISDTPEARQLAELASWYEIYDFPDDAIKFYRQAIEITPNKEWSFRLAEHLFEKGDNDAAISTWESVLNPDTAGAAEYAEVAAIFDAFQQTEKAEAAWSKAIEHDPENLDYDLQLARNLMRQEKFTDAVTAFTRLTDQSDNIYFQERGEAGRLDAYSQLGILDEKQKEWEQELLDSPDSLEVLGRLARLYQRAGQRESALTLLEKRTQLEPNNTDFRRDLIRAFKSGRYVDEAIEELLKLAAADKTRARVYYQELLEIYLSLDLRDEAIKTGETIIALAPADAEARLDLAQVYTLYRRQEDGLQQYRYALRLEPNEPDYQRQYGEALLLEKKYGEAQLAFQRMLDTAKEDDTRLSAVASLTRIHQYQNSLDELVSEFNRRIRNTPKKLSAYKELSRIFQESGSVEKSLSTLEEGLQNVDDKAPALQSLIRSAYELQDFRKVLTYYEQLIEQRGKPSAYEYEKLGSIYAQMGDLSKARETWNLMIDGESKDPKAYDRLSSILQRENFVNEAIEFKLQAVELDEYNFKRRWEYAQMLASTERGIDAIEQLQQLLELGDRQQQESPEKAKEKTVRRRNRGPQTGQQLINPYMYIYGIQRTGQGYYGGSPRGTFSEIRPQVVGFMASLAQNSMGEDALVAQFLEKVKKQPKNTQAKRDLMLVYQSYGRVEDALNTATEILKMAPNDAQLLQQTAVYYASNQEHAKAIPLLEKLAESQPKFRNQALQGLIPLYFQTQEQEKALELTKQILEEDTSNTQSIYILASLMQQQGKIDEAIDIYKQAQDKADPAMGSALNMNLSRLYVQTGKTEEAKKLFTEMLTKDSRTSARGIVRRPRIELYMPEISNPNSRVRYGGGAIRNLPPSLIGQIDYQKSEAIRQLRLLADTGENPVEPLENQAEQFLTAKNQNKKDAAWDAAKLLIAYHLSQSEYDEAQAWLDKLADAAGDRLEWLNLSLFLAKSKDDCDSMVAHYADAENRFPSIARKLVTAKAAVSILCEDYEAAATYIRQMNQQRVPPKEIVAMIQPFLNADESSLAKTLLEEHLAGISRNGEALALLAKIYGEEDNHEQAIALAREAWDRSSHGSSNQNYRYGSFNPGRTSRPTDALLRSLHQYYVKAGRSEDLVKEFATRLEQQPGSVQLHENLATLHQLNNERDKAITIYETLIQKRPHLTQAKQTLARFHSETGNFAKATEIYESLLKTNPNIYQQISWELRNLYQRSGKGKEIIEMEKDLAKRATNPNQIQQLANQFQQNGELEKAAELYLKAIKMSPGYPWLNRQLADVYIKLGRHDDAIKLYREWLASPAIRAQGNVDTGTLQHLAGVYTSTGRLDELKEINQGFIDKNKNDPIATGLTAQIAVFEKRFDDAITQMAKSASSGMDPNALNGLLELGEITGRIDAVFKSVKDPALFQNFYDKRRIAKIYFAKGDIEKGKKLYTDWIEEQSQYGGSTWYYIREAVDQFGDFGLWEDAEALIRKHHRNNMQDRDRREFSRIISEFYVNNDRFGDFVEEILSKDSYKGSDADLITSIAEGYRRSNMSDKRISFLSRIVERDSSNRKLVTELARLHLSNNPSKTIELANQLVEAEPANAAHRQLLADAMFNHKEAAQAIEMLRTWVAEKESESRYGILSTYQDRNRDLKGARKSLEKAIELADLSKKQSATLRLAEFDSKNGQIAAVKSEQAKHFSEKTDANAFNQYLTFLRSYGYYQEARDFFFKHKDDGYTDRYRNQNHIEVFTDQGDFETPIDISWNFIRYTENYNRQNSFRTAERAFRDRGRLIEFLDGIRARVEAEETLNLETVNLLAEAYASAGIKDGADALHQLLAEKNPYNQTYALSRASWLSKTGRTQEAIDIIDKLHPAPTIREEVQNQIQLFGFHLKNKASESAGEVAQELLSWSNNADTEIQIGNLYFQEKFYDKALHHYENSLGKYQRNNYNAGTQLLNLGKCYALGKQPQKAIEMFEKARTKRNSSYLFNSLPQWLEANQLYDTAIAYHHVRFRDRTPSIQDISHLANCILNSKGAEAAIVAFQSAWDVSEDAARENLTGIFAGFISKHELHDSLSSSPEIPLVEASLVKIAIQVLQSTNKEKALSKIEPILDAIKEDHAVALSLGKAYSELGKPELALSQLTHALASKTPSLKLSAANALAKLDPSSDKIAPAVVEAVGENHEIVLASTATLEDFLKLAPREAIDQWLASVLETSPFESQRTYYQFLVAHFRGTTEAAAELLKTLTNNPSLSGGQLNHLASICKKADQTEEAIVFLNRVAGGGYRVNEKWKALGDLSSLYLKGKDYDEALSCLSRLYPVWRLRDGQKPIKALYNKVTEQDLSSLKQGIENVISTNPQHDRVPTFVGLYSEILEKFEAKAPVLESTLTDRQSRQAQALTDMIESWEIAGPFDPGTARGNQGNIDIPFTPETQPDNVNWTEVGPKESFGYIHLDSILGLDGPKSDNQVAYARTILNSPDERQITLGLGSDDWVKVWINGDEVHSYASPRSAFPDQDLIQIPLQAGDNQLLLKIGNVADSWRFCLRIKEHGEGVNVSATQ